MAADPSPVALDHAEPAPLRRMRLVWPLLEQMLTRAYGFRNTPLQFEIDSGGIAVAAWNAFWPDVAAADAHLLVSGKQICAALDGLIERALDADGEAERPGGAGSAARDEWRGEPPEKAADQLPQLAGWLDRLCALLRGVDARAIEIIGLCVEGYTPRDVAQRLGTGLRLVQRLLADVRQQWHASRQVE